MKSPFSFPIDRGNSAINEGGAMDYKGDTNNHHMNDWNISEQVNAKFQGVEGTRKLIIIKV